MSRKAEIIGEIMCAAIDISTHNRVDIFVSYAPHVNKLSIDYHFGGWSTGQSGAGWHRYLDEINVKDLKKQLKKIKRLRD